MKRIKVGILTVLLFAVGGFVEANAQVTGQITVTLTAEQVAHVKAAVETYNANNGTSVTVLQWASAVATKAIVEQAKQDNALELKAIRNIWPELTQTEREALVARKKEILAAQAE